MQLALRKKGSRQLGATAVEYALTLAVVVAIVMGGAKEMTKPISIAMECASSAIALMTGNQPPAGSLCGGGSTVGVDDPYNEGEEIYIAPPDPVKEEEKCKDDCQKDYEKNEGESADFFLDETYTCETSFDPPLISSCKLSIILMYEIMQDNNEEQLNECINTCST